MKKILTLVLDGIGHSEKEEGNALKMANMPNFNKVLESYPHTLLEASSLSVGLGKDQPGNEEIGFKTLGAGKKLKQRSSYMNDLVDKDSLSTNSVLKSAIEHAKKSRSTIHIIGLMSDGGICSNIKDTIKLIQFLKEQSVKIVVDFIADGKDVEAKSASKYIEMINNTGVPIASICGRYYAMDTEGKWDRIKVYYDLIRNGVGLNVKEIPLALKNCYIRNITDEFLPPMIVEQGKNLKNKDVVLWTNYDDESNVEILSALASKEEFKEFKREKLENFKLLTIYPIMDEIESEALIKEEDDSVSNLGNYFSKLGITQARIGLKSAMPYVTYYFNGENDKKIAKCNHYNVESPNVETERPRELAMAALTKQIIKVMEKDTDFILANMNSIDEVGHTGSIEETVKTLEFMDECLGKILESASLNFYTIFIVSTHGNVEEMILPDGKFSTTHTTNKVPFIVTDSKKSLESGTLCDVAPTILNYMDISVPEAMKESNILIKD